MLTTKVKSDLQRWNTLPLSLAGRVQTIKMNILPRYLYLFQCLPIFLPKSFFTKLDSMISFFIWEGKTPRIRLPLLQRVRAEGGLGLPEFRLYYWAANIHKIILWRSEPDNCWCRLEASSCVSSSIEALVCCPIPFAPSKFSNNPIVVSTLKIWNQIRKEFGWSLLTLSAPICNNHLFLPARMDSGFSMWEREGLINFKDLYCEGQFGGFGDLCEIYNLQRSDMFRYFQVRNFVKTHSPIFPEIPARSGIEVFMPAASLAKGVVSYLYEAIPRKDPGLGKIKSSWETELGFTFSDEWWEQATERVNSSSSCARLSLIQFKVLHRTHYSKARLSKIYPDVTDCCDRCSQSPGNLSHMFWSCPKLIQFWKFFFEAISEILGKTIAPCPHIAIFGIPDEEIALTNKQVNVIAFASLIARRRILLQWKSKSPPSAKAWLIDVMSFLKLEKIKFTIRGSSDKFYNYWQPLIAYVSRLRSLSPD